MLGHHLELVAPFDGIIVPLANVPDPVFSGGMAGDGLAIEPTSQTLLAPCDGTVSHLARTKHALTLTTDSGAEVLIHIGIDTVHLNGDGFNALVKQGDKIKCGQPLVEVDFDAVARLVPSLITVVVIANDGWNISHRSQGIVQAGKSGFFSFDALDASTDIGGRTPRGDDSESFVHLNARVAHTNGLHARPATAVQNVAKKFNSEIFIEFNGCSANARSIVAIMGLGVGQDADVKVSARGSDAAVAAQAVVEALQFEGQSSKHTKKDLPTPAQKLNLDESSINLAGVCAAPGIAVGKIVRMNQVNVLVPELGTGLDVELAAFAETLAKERKSLVLAAEAAAQRNATDERDILNAHLALLDDIELITGAEQAILQGKSAGFAIRSAVDAQGKILKGLGIALFTERIDDLKDIEQQLLAGLGYLSNDVPELYEASIVVADEMLPTKLSRLPREKLAGIALAYGGATSHVAIIARNMGIPALVAVGPRLLSLNEGQVVILDAHHGMLETEPTATRTEAVLKQVSQTKARRDELLLTATMPAQTLDGIVIKVAGNIANCSDAVEAMHNGADAIGLLRSEFLFMDRDHRPTVSEQLSAYQAVVDVMNGRPTTIRSLDIGGDKPVSYLSLPKEENPALGIRGVRVSQADTELFDEQLMSILQLKPLSNVQVMVPMIADIEEVLWVRRRIEIIAAKMGLSALPKLGVMIEIPSAAVLADQLAEHVDFFSIGTNDLTQYALAMDRGNPALASRLDQLHPAVLRLIAMTINGAQKYGRWVGVCGGVASDPCAVPVLIGLGISELSVASSMIAEIKALVRSLDHEECVSAMTEILALNSAAAVRAEVMRRWPQCVQQ